MSTETFIHKFPLPSSPSPYLRAFLAWIDAYNAWDLDRILACYDDSLQHYILPKSLNRPVRSKNDYKDFYDKIIPMFQKFTVTLLEVFEDGERISAHASSIGESSTGGAYANEYNLIAHFIPLSQDADPDELPKISLVKEFVDSAFSEKFFAEERVRIQERAKLRKEKA